MRPTFMSHCQGARMKGSREICSHEIYSFYILTIICETKFTVEIANSQKFTKIYSFYLGNNKFTKISIAE